jgi:hypothetical protein
MSVWGFVLPGVLCVIGALVAKLERVDTSRLKVGSDEGRRIQLRVGRLGAWIFGLAAVGFFLGAIVTLITQ